MKLAVDEGESSEIVGLVVTASILVRELEEDVALGGLDAGEVDGAGGAERHDFEIVGLAGGGGDEADGDEGGEEDGLDLHLGGCEGLWDGARCWS